MGKKKIIKGVDSKLKSDKVLLNDCVNEEKELRLRKAAEMLLEDYEQRDGVIETTLLDTGDIYEY